MRFLLILLALTITSTMAQSVYILKPGETLSGVLKQHNKTPLYGDNQWVEKTLKLNRITAKEALNLDAGSAVMLPIETKPQFIKGDEIKTSKSAPSRHGLIGGQVSNHQKLSFHLDYFFQKTVLNNFNADLKENFGLGLDIMGNNNRSFDNFKWNAFGGIYSSNQGAAKFKEDDTLTARFQPDMKMYTGVTLQPDNSHLKIAGQFTIEEKSLLEETANNSVYVGRHQFAWFGVGGKHTLEKGKYIFNNELLFEISVGHQAVNDSIQKDIRSATKASYHSSINLTKMTHAGFFVTHQKFSDTSLVENNSIGLRLSTDLK